MRHTYGTRREKRIDFWLGFVIWPVSNGVLIFLISIGNLGTVAGPLAGLGLILANVAALILLAFSRQFMAMGVAIAFASALALTVTEGIFSTIGDFVAAASGYNVIGTSTNPPQLIAAMVIGAIVFAIGAFFALRAIHRSIK